ncbi:MAG TPA: hypothetical protein VFO73_04245 [Candidatus Limnocylindrales bacterium]|nr:hypothetical protein [Candidatus Limnocylindrales bacterium]
MVSRRTVVALVIAVATLGGCSGPPAAASPAGATTYLEFREAFCSAFDGLFRAIGNPDTGSDSELMAQMEAAIAAGDRATVERVAREIVATLEAAREHGRFAGGWAPASPLAAPLDRMLVTFEVLVEAKRSAAGEGIDAANSAGQTAFEQAGGLEAWTNLLRAFQDPAVMGALASARPADLDPQCPTVPISV